MAKAKYNRILLKLSGEAWMGQDAFGVNPEIVTKIVKEIKVAKELGIEVAVVIGGGNIFRGVALGAAGMDRATADYMGMLATIMNALSLQSCLEQINLPTRVQSAISMSQIAEPYIKRKAVRHLEKSRIVIFAAGTGNPFFSTDTAASLRASEMGCTKILKATKVNGIYDSDPNIDKNAKLIKNITYSEVISKNLRVMDLTAISLAKESNIPIYITNIFERDSLIRALNEEGNYSKIQ